MLVVEPVTSTMHVVGEKKTVEAQSGSASICVARRAAHPNSASCRAAAAPDGAAGPAGQGRLSSSRPYGWPSRTATTRTAAPIDVGDDCDSIAFAHARRCAAPRSARARTGQLQQECSSTRRARAAARARARARARRGGRSSRSRSRRSSAPRPRRARAARRRRRGAGGAGPAEGLPSSSGTWASSSTSCASAASSGGERRRRRRWRRAAPAAGLRGPRWWRAAAGGGVE